MVVGDPNHWLLEEGNEMVKRTLHSLSIGVALALVLCGAMFMTTNVNAAEPGAVSSVTVTANPESVLTGQATQVTVTVADESGQPVVGAQGMFTWTGSASTSGSLYDDAIIPPVFITDGNGQAGIPLLGTVPQTLTVTATIGTASGSTDVTYLPIPTPDLSQSTISVDNSNSSVTVTIKDASGTPLPMQNVVFVVPENVTIQRLCPPSQCPIQSGASVMTDSTGVAYVYLESSDGGQVPVQVMVLIDGVAQPLDASPVMAGTAQVTPGNGSETADVGLVVVSGTLTVGDTLDATVFNVVPESATLTYQWYRDDEPIDQATDATYAVTANDLTPYLTLVVTASAPGYDPGTKEVPILKVGSVDKPVITGDPAVGSRLTATSANMDAFGTLVYSWQRVSRTVSTTVPDATGSMYLVTSDDVGMQVRVCVSDVEYPTPLFCSTTTDEIVEQHGMGALPPVTGTLALSDSVPWIGHPTTATVRAINTITGAPDGAGIPVTFTVSGSATLSADGEDASTDGQSLQVLTDENGQATVTVNDMTVEKASVTAVFTNWPITVSGSPAEVQFSYGMEVVPPSVDPAQSSVSVDQTMATVGQPITATLVVKGIAGVPL